MIVNKEMARHYVWGGNCDGWHFLESDSLSVILEKIPPGGGEVLHFHNRAQQLFYILSGAATFDAEGREYTVTGGEGFRVQPGVPHRIRNLDSRDLHFLVISEPKTQGDRVNV